MIDDDIDRFLGEVIDDRQALQPPAMLEGIADEIHRPHLVRSLRDGEWPALDGDPAASAPPLHLQPFLAIQPMHALDVHLLALTAQQRVNAPIAEPAPLRGQRHDACPQDGRVRTGPLAVMQHRA